MERSSRPPRYFTLDEARHTLPQVRSCIERLQALGAEVARLQQAMQEGSHALRQAPPAHNGAAKNGSGRRVYDALARRRPFWARCAAWWGSWKGSGAR